jgi:cellulose synthase/poly-beta-1,6-N-acetylglucosamine synthase-like glycosyltransferase
MNLWIQKAVLNMITWSTYALICYVSLVTLFYLALFIISARQLRKESGLQLIQYEDVLHSSFTPPLSILVPAYNEETGIVSSVRSLLGINYQEYEIIVINDGSKDGTLRVMVEEFDLSLIKGKIHWSGLEKSTQAIRGVYRSSLHPNLFMVDKENGGKSDALNVGVNLSKYPYFVSLDGDTVLDTDAFIKVIKPIVEARPGEEIIATGGSVGIANGSFIQSGYLNQNDVALSRNRLIVMQVIEYLRAFLMGRIGLSKYNLLLIVSGAFGVFKKSWVIEAGGYEIGTVGEDMELVVRLHRRIKEKKSKARIVYIPDPVCWTEAPESFSILHRQRTRWHRGLFESMWKHKKMLFNPRYGGIGMVSMPYFVLVELLGPVIEMIGYMCIAFGFMLDALNLEYTIILSAVMLLYGSFLSMGAVLLEEWGLRKYTKPWDVTRLFFYALTEALWYRPLMTLWRFEGFIQAIGRKKVGWGEMTRKAGVMGTRR